MAKRKYTFIDLFAGCGGLSEGFLDSGHYKSLAHVEWEKPMVDTLRHRLIKKWGYTIEEAKSYINKRMNSCVEVGRKKPKRNI